MKITTRMVGAEAKKARKNPIGRQETYVLAEENLATLKKRYQTLLLTMADLRDSLRRRKKGLPDDDMRGYTDAEISKLIKHYQTRAEDLRGAIAEYERGDWWKNPAHKPAMKRNPGAKTMYRFALVPNDGGFEYGMDDRTPVRFVFSARDRKKGIYRSFQLPASAVQNAAFQAWVNSLPGADVVMTLGQLRQVIRSYMT